MLEEWLQIEDFPDYYISNYGRVKSEISNRNLMWSPIQYGIPTVGLMRDGKQWRRSVPVLVAKTFLPPPLREDFDTPIHLDGDRSNPRADNLMWRPRWFAVNFHKQRTTSPYPNWNRDIQLVETGEVFDNPSQIAEKYGLLEDAIHKAILNGTEVFPQGYTFRFLD